MAIRWHKGFIRVFLAVLMLGLTHERCTRCLKKKNQTTYVGNDVSIAFYDNTPSFITKSYDNTRLLKWMGYPRLDLLESYFFLSEVDTQFAKEVRAPFRDIRKVRNGTEISYMRSYINGVEFTLQDVTEDMSGYYTGVIYDHDWQVVSYGTVRLEVKRIQRIFKRIDKRVDPSETKKTKKTSINVGLTILVTGIGVMFFIALAMVLGVYVRSKNKRTHRASPPRPLNVGPSSISDGLLLSSDHEYSVVSPEQRGDAYLAVDPNSVCDTSEGVPFPPPRPTTTVPLSGTEESSPDSYYIC